MDELPQEVRLKYEWPDEFLEACEKAARIEGLTFNQWVVKHLSEIVGGKAPR